VAENECSVHLAFSFTAGEKISRIFSPTLVVQMHNFIGYSKLNLFQSKAKTFCVKIRSFIFNW
jgi:hypothetical protein